MSARAYYNEIDPKAAAWLRELIKRGLIPAGEVDERSIVDVRGSDLAEYNQCHFFAGIGGWPYALMLAGWPAEWPVWTGSCPCQPFSCAGKGKGTDDERHLWPEFARLIGECRPTTVFGEQVASKAGREWLAGVFADLEGMGYAAAGADLCAAGVGAPHIRQRLFWVADSNSDRGTQHEYEQREGSRRAAGPHNPANGGGNHGGLPVSTQQGRYLRGGSRGDEIGEECGRRQFAGHGEISGVCDATGAGPLPGAHGRVCSGEEGAGARHGEPQRSGDAGGLPNSERTERRPQLRADERDRGDAGRNQAAGGVGACGEVGGLQHATRDGREQWRAESGGRGAECGCGAGGVSHAGREGCAELGRGRDEREGLAPPGFWSDFDILPFRDGKARRVESGTFPLAHGVSNRVVKLRGFGNAIVPQVAAEFIKAYIEASLAA